MDLGARRYTRNDILRDICCLIAPPIYSFIYKGCRNEDCRRALLFLLLEVISFVLDLLGGNHWVFLLTSFILSACNSLIIMYAYFVVKRYSRIKLEAGQKDIVVEIVFSCLQLIVSGFCLIRTLLGVNTNYSASVFPLTYAIISIPFAFKNCKGVSNSSSNTSTNSPTDQIVEVEHTDQLQLNDIQVDPSNTPTDQIGKVEDTKTSQLSNIYDVEPSNSQSNEVQQIPNTLRNTCAQSNDQGQVDPSNTRIAHIGNAEDTNPSPLSNTCEPSDTPIKDFVPSRSHSDEVQQVPNMLRKRRNTFKQSDQGEENKNLRPGDWNCIPCNQLNFRRRDWCQRCGEPRTGYHKGSFGGRISGSGPDVRPGDWYCMNCAAHNLACRSSCFKCGASNDEPGSDMPKIRGFGFGSGSSGRKSGDWISTRSGCKEHNFGTW
ncbi:hypothetical protein ACOSQ3_004124 [Xanthoceras sorbifolium]